MQNKYFRICCLLLSLVLVVNLLPFQAWAVLRAEDSSAVLASPEQTDVPAEEAHIVHELEDERTEYSKVYRLSNGLHMAAVYNEPVHYEKDGQWEDIDNTLVTKDGMLSNTAGVWDVSFPQSMSSTNAVTIEKDGYTLSFYMAGQVRKLTMAPIGQDPVSLMAVTSSAAQVQTLDLTAEKEAAEHPETVLENTHSRLQYTGVFSNTNVVYDLVSNRVKESIIIGAYDADLQGYRYTLNTGSLTPVLTDSGEILLIGTDKQTVVMTMPAPYLVDNNGEYSYDVTVDLQGAKGTYVLTYTLPTAWMADSSRSYPVVLDPMVEAESTLDNIVDVSVYENNPKAYNYSTLDVGYDTQSHGAMRTYVMFNNLPDLEVSDIVVQATFGLYHFPTSAADLIVGVHKVNGPWTETGISWENQPGHNTLIEDFCLVNGDEDDFTWDVTEIVRDWYLKGNTGLLLRGSDDVEQATRSYYHQFHAENYSKWHRPTLTVTYRSAVGIESYYTYATLGAGNAGGVYLSDSNGQITAVKEIASYASTVNPFSLSMVYNSIYFLKDGTASHSPLQAMGLSMTMGNGWTLDVVQKLTRIRIDDSTYYMKYHDGDGTVHYFTQSGTNKFKDEDGLGLTITLTSGTCVMADDTGNTWTFTDSGIADEDSWFMTSTLDNNGNGYSMTYTNGQLTTIKQTNKDQAAITVASLTYSGNQVTAIADATGDSYSFIYSGNNLINVSRVYNSTKSYLCGVYAYSGSRLTTMTDNLRGYSLIFEYGAIPENGVHELSSGRVVSYREESNGDTGIRCDISYPSYTQTTYHSYGNDHDAGNDDDLYTHYLFDYAGRTVNAYTTDATNINILGASMAAYTDNSGISNTNNRTLRTASIGVAAQNLLIGGNIEGTTEVWTYSNASRSSSEAHMGSYAVKGTPTANAAASAQRQSLALEAEKPYSLSAYIKTTDLSNFQTTNTNLTRGAGVYLKVVTANGQVFYSDTISYATSESMENGWIRLSMSFTPTMAGVCTVYIVGEGATGTFYADDVQLEKGEAPSALNLIENSGLQASSSAFAWSLNEDASLCTTVGVNAEGSGNHSIQIDGDCENKYARAVQTIQINKTGEQTYVLSGWGKAYAVDDNITRRTDLAYDDTKQFGLRATVNYAGDTTNYWKEYYYVPFNSDISTWQYASLTITPKYADKEVAYINVSLVYECNANTAWFDNLSLVNASVNSYTYDSTTGNLTSMSSTGQDTRNIVYDTDGNVIEIRNASKLEYKYTYDTNIEHRLLTTSNSVFKETLSYDAVGNVTGTVLESLAGDSKQIITSSEYTNGGNLIYREIDEAGNATTYGYGSLSDLSVPASCDYTEIFYKTFGVPSTVTNAKNVTTSYVTDTFGRIREMYLEDLATIKYTYGKTRLHEIQRTTNGKTQIYQYNYDNFDNVTSVGIGAHNATDAIILVEYDYGDNNSLLSKQTYANGDTVTYEYDNLGRTTTETYKNAAGQIQRQLTYVYTGDGQLYSIQDSKTGYTYQYNYGALGTLLSSTVEDSNGNLILELRPLNVENRDGGQQWKLGDTTYVESYVCNDTDGSVTAFYAADGSTISLGYDVLQRLVSASNGVYTKSYSYRDITATQTTTQVSGLTYSGITDAPSYGYTYDVLGNLLTYTEDGITYTYTYDDQGQLTAAVVTDANGNQVASYSYSYDDAGNITSANGHNYGYSDGVWKDLLVSYDGHTISYDASGNPTTYYNGTAWSFTWAEGRKLATASGNGHNISYTYDANGLRTSKTVDATEYRYVYNGGVLLRQTGDGKTLDFIYDNNGAPYALIYNNGSATETYYYITNLQGDVMKLVDEDGATVASYSYDPYGKLITNPQEGTIAAINPLRYRGYYYDSESSLYYLRSRYYDACLERFINADDPALTSSGGIFNNLFLYCENTPVSFKDPSGYTIDTVFDIGSILVSLLDLIGAPSWKNLFYLLWDLGAALIPFVPGSYLEKGGRYAIKVASAIEDFASGSKFLTGTYNKLSRLFNGIRKIYGIEIHHLVEQRFAKLFKGTSLGDFLSIPLGKELHQLITNRWSHLHELDDYFKLFQRGSNYSLITYEMMEKAIKQVYYDIPWLRDLVLEWFRSNWRP